MGVRHIVAFGLMAIIGNCFLTQKLVGYIGLSPSKVQSGNNVKGREKGTGNTGRGDVRALLVQSAQNALNYRESALHKWGWKLALKKHRNLAVAAVARKLVAIWYLLRPFTPLRDDKTVTTKAFGYCRYTRKETLKDMGFEKRNDFYPKTI